jgi:SAM-dependent methyltransferase
VDKFMSFLRRPLRLLADAGIDIFGLWQFIKEIPRYIRQRRAFRNAWQEAGRPLEWGPERPCVRDWSAPAGTITGAYFIQDLLVAQRIHAAKPLRHLDVGSRIDGFVAHVASFRQIEVIDCRPLRSPFPAICTIQHDLLDPLPQEFLACTDSLSCLHALEHIGLGRYGDQLDPRGHERSLSQLAALLKPQGILYLSLPLGRSRIEFNAHRVFSFDDMRALIAITQPQLRITRISIINDAGDLLDEIDEKHPMGSYNFGCNYGCAIFEMMRC